MTPDKHLFERRDVVRGVALGVLASPFAFTSPARAGETGFTTITGIEAKIGAFVLEQLPYTRIGSGTPIYVVISALCPYCQIMYRKYPDIVPGLELRYIAEPLREPESGEVVKVWQDRSATTFKMYMAHRFVGMPPVRNAFADGFPNGVPKTLHGPEEFYGYHLAYLDSVGSRFQKVYPTISFTATPRFYIPNGDTLIHASGNAYMDIISKALR